MCPMKWTCLVGIGWHITYGSLQLDVVSEYHYYFVHMCPAMLGMELLFSQPLLLNIIINVSNLSEHLLNYVTYPYF